MAVEIVRLRVPERVQSYLICRVCVFVLLDTMQAVVTSFPFLMCPFFKFDNKKTLTAISYTQDTWPESWQSCRECVELNRPLF